MKCQRFSLLAVEGGSPKGQKPKAFFGVEQPQLLAVYLTACSRSASFPGTSRGFPKSFEKGEGMQKDF